MTNKCREYTVVASCVSIIGVLYLHSQISTNHIVSQTFWQLEDSQDAIQDESERKTVGSDAQQCTSLTPRK